MEKQVKIISFANHKGGVGKTTTTASVGSILASMGKKGVVGGHGCPKQSYYLPIKR